MSDSAMPNLIRTEAELRTWLDAIPDRHKKVNDHRCSCGWSFEHGPTWEEHAEGGPIHDLGNYLPSSTFDNGPVPYAQLERDLYGSMDRNHKLADVIADTLCSIALGASDPAALAAAVLCKMWPHSAWAEAIHAAGIEPDLSLAAHVPADP